LKGTLKLGITFHRRKDDSSDLRLVGYTDSDWAGEPEENDLPMRSTSGMVSFLEGIGPLAWFSTLIPTISQSTAEAEYKGVGLTGKWLSGTMQIFQEIGIPLIQPCILYCDNQAARTMAKAQFSGSKTRHIKINHHYIRELIDIGEIDVVYCPTGDMVADIMTKALPPATFQKCRKILLN
jgi:hypothetical protein